MHIDTGHNFPEAIEFRDRRVAELGERLVVASVQESIDQGRVVEQTGPRASRNQLQTTTLLDAMTEHGFDAAIGGARRDEERSRAKERIFSFRDDFGQWDPRAQRPELWNLYNGRIRKGEQVRVFPISNWTELDVWQYVAREQLDLPAIYFAHEREVFERDGMLYAASEFIERYPHEEPFSEWVRFRTVGDMSCTGGVRSHAATIEEVVREIAATRVTERGETRADDKVSRGRDGRSQAGRVLLMAASISPRCSPATAADSELLRLVTCGSVDDGKSTLIGRLLYDSKQVMADQLEHVEETSERRGDGYVNLALLTDGLRAEREQGITIDVAYRSFVTPTRRFQLADAPGHVQYTRNMVTGASTADVAVVLLDARKGVIEQTRRHTFISATLGIPHIVFAVNKMDLVDFDEARFREIESGAPRPLRAAWRARRDRDPDRGAPRRQRRRAVGADAAGGTAARSSSGSRRSRSPATATRRTAASPCSGWSGRCPTSTTTTGATRARSRVASGAPATRSSSSPRASGRRSRRSRRTTGRSTSPCRASPSSSGSRTTSTSPGATCSAIPADPPVAARELEATVCWMSERPVETGARLALKQTTRWSRAILDEVTSVLDVETFEQLPADGLRLNDLARVRLRLAGPLLVDPYAVNRQTGAFVLVDEATNETVGAGMVLAASA